MPSRLAVKLSAEVDVSGEKRLLKTLIRRLPVAAAMLDRNVVYLEASDRWCADYGLRPAGEVIGRGHYDLFPEIPQRWKDVIQLSLSGETFHAENDLFVRPDGVRKWLNWEVQPWGIGDGDPQGVLIFSEDVTTRFEAERAFYQTERHYRAVFENMNEGLAQLRMISVGGSPVDFEYVAVNRRYTEITGSKDVAGRRVSEVMPGWQTSDHGLFAHYTNVATTGVPLKIETFVEFRNKWFSISASCPEPGYVNVIFDDITERKQLELANRNYLDFVDTVNSAVPGAVFGFRLSPTGTTSFPYLTPGLRTIWPEAPDMQKDAGPFFDAIHPEDRDQVRALVRDSTLKPVAGQASFRIVSARRGEVWVEARYIPRQDPDGSVSWYGVLTDVTDQKAVEHEILRSHRAYQRLVDNLPDAVGRVDPDGYYLFVNRPAASLMGLSRDAVVCRRIDEMGAPESLSASLMDALRRAVETGQITQVELKKLREVWDVRAVPEFDETGSVQSVLLLGQDISERRSAELAARQAATEAQERESIITALFDTAAQAILAVDVHGKIHLANPMAEQMFGYGRGEMVGLSHDVLLPEKLRVKHASLRARFTAAPRRRPMGQGVDLQARRRDGTLFPVEVSLGSIETARGLLAVSFVSDITARRQQALALAEAENESARLRLALLTAVEDTLRSVARELHDNISQKLTFLSLEISHACAGTPKKELLRKMHEWQTAVAGVSEDVRQISHRMHPAILEDLGISDAIEELCSNLQTRKGISATFISSRLPEPLDRRVSSCLYRVAQESLTNIARHSRATQVDIQISAENNVLSLEIADNGRGFDIEARSCGFGIRSMRERMRLIGGSFQIQSSPGSGVRILATVPLSCPAD